MYMAFQLLNRVGKVCAVAVAILFLSPLAYAGQDRDKGKQDERAFIPTYTLTDLGLLQGYSETVTTDLNDRGAATGIALPSGNASNQGVLFLRGKVIDVAPGAVASYASAINGRGQVTGYFDDGQKWQGFLYDSGFFKSFAAPNATATYADSLNDVGQIAGSYTDANSKDHIFVRQANGTFQDLGVFGIDPSALAVNNQGRVLLGTNDGVRDHTYLSRPGSVGLEEVPSLIPDGSVSAGDMNQWGVVVGTASVDASTGDEHAYIYFEGKIKDLGVLPGGDSTWGYGINNLGQTVGQAIQAPKPIYGANGEIIGYTPQITHGWVSLDGKPRDVNRLLHAAFKGWEISVARKVNDRGQVLADANFNGGETHGVLLTPNAILPPLVSVFP
jgi:probable HAF family extracellular repeat protein